MVEGANREPQWSASGPRPELRPRYCSPVPRRSHAYRTPRAWVVDGGTWPNGPFQEDTPTVTGYAVHISVELTRALEGRNKRDVAAAAGIERSTLYDLINGSTWSDTVTLGRLELVLDTSLWPGQRPVLPA